MAIITLTTDWNKSDYYLGTVKGKILSKDINTQIVDITHQIQPFNIMEAAFIIRNSCFNFPKGTIHIIAVNAASNKKQSLLVIENEGQFFISSNSGLVGLISNEKPKAVYQVKNTLGKTDFLDMDAYIDTAFKLIENKSLNSFCVKTDDYESQTPLRPVIDKNLISGSVIYIDSFANAITNVSRETFEKVGQSVQAGPNQQRVFKTFTGWTGCAF
jgi:S-adenosylmethionine hydrolase